MADGRFSSISDQVTEAIRQGIVSGRWKETLPGRSKLAGLFDVSPRTIDKAIQRLSADGLLVSQGRGSKRKIVLPKGKAPVASEFRFSILNYRYAKTVDTVQLNARYALKAEGFSAEFATKSQADLQFCPKQIAKFVERNPADAWVIPGGSPQIFEWFSAQSIPAFALFGEFKNLPIAGAGRFPSDALEVAVNRLIALGHRRIVFFTSRERCTPEVLPDSIEEAFLDLLRRHNIRTGPYHLPLWDGTAKGIETTIDRLFQHTPPTAIIIGPHHTSPAILLHLARRGIRVPEQVSVISMAYFDNLPYMLPEIAYFAYDQEKIFKRLVRWAHHVSQHKEDRSQWLGPSEFVEGETLGPPGLP